MFKKLSDGFYHCSGGWVVIAAAVIFVVFMIFVLPGQSARVEVYSAGVGTPDTSLFYTPQDLIRMAEAYGVEGRQAYVQARFTFDLAFPFVYTFFLVVCISWLLNQRLSKNNPLRMINLLPLGGFVFDLLENICAARVIGMYPLQESFAAFWAAIFTPVKWLFVGIGFALLTIAIILTMIPPKEKSK
jgi:hypothetical protein